MTGDTTGFLLFMVFITWAIVSWVGCRQGRAEARFFKRSLPTLVLSFLRCRVSAAYFCATICFGNATLLSHSLICCTNDGEQLENSVHPSFGFGTTFITLLFSIACRERAWQDFLVYWHLLGEGFSALGLIFAFIFLSLAMGLACVVTLFCFSSWEHLRGFYDLGI